MMPNTSILRVAFFLAALVSVATLMAQTPGMVVFGTVRELNTRDSIPFPTVLVEEVGSEGTAHADRDHRARPVRGYDDCTKTYWIRSGAPGKVMKSVQLELKGPSDEDWANGSARTSTSRCPTACLVDHDLFSQPFGIARFKATLGNYEWDAEYTRSLRDRQKALLEAYRERLQQQQGSGR
ncbi:MAG: hypothetical protein IPO05_16630 [Flavobacteriales bacterium]|nr:hypothetical protein [Flavobacteriales bacterium]